MAAEQLHKQEGQITDEWQIPDQESDLDASAVAEQLPRLLGDRNLLQRFLAITAVSGVSLGAGAAVAQQIEAGMEPSHGELTAQVLDYAQSEWGTYDSGTSTAAPQPPLSPRESARTTAQQPALTSAQKQALLMTAITETARQHFGASSSQPKLPDTVERISKVTYYSQTDPRWSQDQYEGPGGSGTIGWDGCGPTSLAMVLSTLGNKVVTPSEIAQYNMAHGLVTPDGATYDDAMTKVPEAYGLKAEQIPVTDSSVKQAIAAGGLVIIDGTRTANMDFPTPATTAGHFYVIDYVNDVGGFMVKDPASAANTAVAWNPEHILTPADVAYAIYPSEALPDTRPPAPTSTPPATPPAVSDRQPVLPSFAPPEKEPAPAAATVPPPTTAVPRLPPGKTITNIPGFDQAPGGAAATPPPPPAQSAPPKQAPAAPSTPEKPPASDPTTPEISPDSPDPKELAAYMAAELTQESNGHWAEPPNPWHCSGGFQISDSMWAGHDGYAHASDASPAVQYQFAAAMFTKYWQQFGGDWSKVAMAWYAGPGFDQDNLYVPQPGGAPSIATYASQVVNGSNRNPGMQNYLDGDAQIVAIPGLSPSEYDPMPAATAPQLPKTPVPEPTVSAATTSSKPRVRLSGTGWPKTPGYMPARAAAANV